MHLKKTVVTLLKEGFGVGIIYKTIPPPFCYLDGIFEMKITVPKTPK